MVSERQKQTADTFGYKWSRRDTYESAEVLAAQRDFYHRRYGDIENAVWWSEYPSTAKVLDVGCGAGLTALELFGKRLDSIAYTGVDISEAYLVAQQRFAERGLTGEFLKADMNNLPLPVGAFHVILAEGVLHHTDSTEDAFLAVARHLAEGGRMLGYIYRRKGPIREFTDDYIRENMQGLSAEQAWQALLPLTKLGKALAELNVEVDVPEHVDLLDIPAGKIDLQRLFYWHICKMYHRPEYTLDEMNHVNFDWFTPRNAHRHTKEELISWCGAAGLTIEHLDESELAGYTFIAKR